MKVSLRILMVALFLFSFELSAQVMMGFNYQAVLRDNDGMPLAQQNATVRISIIDAQGENAFYIETHQVTTNSMGLMTFVIGQGASIQGEFNQIPWSAGGISLMVELKIAPSEEFIFFGIQQMQGVPYAFHALNGINAINPFKGELVMYDGNHWVNNKTIISDDESVRVYAHEEHSAEEPIFSVLNSQNQVVFAIYESGIRAYVDNSDSKRPKGGFAVGGYSNVHGKEEEVYYLSVTPDSTRIYFNDANDDGKRPKSGFAVGGYSGAYNYLNVSPGLTQISFVDDGSKRPKGGFAVGGYSNSFGKDQNVDFFSVTPDSTRIYFNDADDGGKRPKGGFAVGGYSGAHSYLNVSPGFTQISFVDDGSKRPKGGFAVGGYSNSFGKDQGVDFFSVTPDSTHIYFNDADDGGKRPKGGFAVGGYSGGHNYLNVSPSLTQVSFVDDGSKWPKGGFAVGGCSNVHGKAEGVDFLMVTPDSTKVSFQDVADGGKRPKGGFAVGGYSGGYSRNYLDVSATHTQVAFADDGSKRPKGGFAVGGYSSSIYKDAKTDNDYFTVTKDSSIFSNVLFVERDLMVEGELIGNELPDLEGKVFDGNGNGYDTLRIGQQTWIAENLRATKYNDGTEIDPGHFMAYDNDMDNVAIFGYLYNTVVGTNDNKKVCPVGWRIPIEVDWEILTAHVMEGQPGNPQQTIFWRLAEEGVVGDGGYWNRYFPETTNAYNFSARPGGKASLNQQGLVFEEKNDVGYYWISFSPQNSNSFIFDGINSSPQIYMMNISESFISIRCIKE